MNSSLQIQDKFPPTCTIYERIGGKPEDYSNLAYAIFTVMIIINVATFSFYHCVESVGDDRCQNQGEATKHVKHPIGLPGIY